MDEVELGIRLRFLEAMVAALVGYSKDRDFRDYYHTKKEDCERQIRASWDPYSG